MRSFIAKVTSENRPKAMARSYSKDFFVRKESSEREVRGEGRIGGGLMESVSD